VAAAPFFPSHHMSNTIRHVCLVRNKHGVIIAVYFFASLFCTITLINMLLAPILCHFSMANTNLTTSHLKTPAIDCVPKPSAASCTKATAPCNINLDEDEENIIPERTRTDHSRSTKQAQIGKPSHIATSSLLSLASDEEALDKEMASLLKRLNAYKKTKCQQEKSL
jgi:hypothetical protein